MTTSDTQIRNAGAQTERRGGPEGSQEAPTEGLLSLVRGRIRTELNARKNAVSQTLDGVAETVRRVGSPLREQSSTLADYADDAAGRLQSFATDLRTRDVGEFADELKKVARRHPGAFVAAGVAAGMLTARFLKSSSIENEAAAARPSGRRVAEAPATVETPGRRRSGPADTGAGRRVQRGTTGAGR